MPRENKSKRGVCVTSFANKEMVVVVVGRQQKLTLRTDRILK